MTTKSDKTPLEKLKERQAKLAAAIAKQEKIEADRAKRAEQQRLLEGGRLLAEAGLLDLPAEALKAALEKLASTMKNGEAKSVQGKGAPE